MAENSLIIAGGFFLGTILGSLAKALADRSLEGDSFLGRSHCPRCGHKLSFLDLFPLLSYLLLKGRCRYCQKAIGIEYILVEVVTGFLIGALFYQVFQNFNPHLDPFQISFLVLDLVFKAFLVTVLVALFITDYKKSLIPDSISLPSIKLAAAFLFLVAVYKVAHLYYYLSQTATGRNLLPPGSDFFQRHALITVEPFLGSIIMAILIASFFSLLIVITSGKGMGGGDVKLGALMGLGLSFPNALVALMLAFLSGAVFSVALIFLAKKHFGQTIPFGPFLVVGSLTTLFFGSEIIRWYLNFTS